MLKTIAILHNLRSVYNTASCFRTANGAGLDKLYLVGTTPSPLNRFQEPRSDFAKVSLGTEKSVPYESVSSLPKLITQLKQDKYSIIAIEQAPSSKDIFKFNRGKKNLALIFGPEVKGLSPSILKLTDQILEIPMHGSKESLNVATAFGIAVYTIK